VEGNGRKEGEGGQPATNLCLTDHVWPPLNSYFNPPLHLAPIMLTSLTRSIKSKENSIHPFPMFFLFKQIPFILFQCSFYLFISEKN
jgi:hypothetical protein